METEAAGAAPPGSRLLSPVDRLTPRELQILDGISLGFTNKAIAGRLGISEQTVKNHVSAIFAKLRVDNRIAALSASGMMRRRRIVRTS